jgi:hypothetical protein
MLGWESQKIEKEESYYDKKNFNTSYFIGVYKLWPSGLVSP